MRTINKQQVKLHVKVLLTSNFLQKHEYYCSSPFLSIFRKDIIMCAHINVRNVALQDILQKLLFILQNFRVWRKSMIKFRIVTW